uniref:Uncharacterized protein n=1 Tax=Lygus hesperus TaxID=30085 RepID=A0A146LSP4_LYGHE
MVDDLQVTIFPTMEHFVQSIFLETLTVHRWKHTKTKPAQVSQQVVDTLPTPIFSNTSLLAIVNADSSVRALRNLNNIAESTVHDIMARATVACVERDGAEVDPADIYRAVESMDIGEVLIPLLRSAESSKFAKAVTVDAAADTTKPFSTPP